MNSDPTFSSLSYDGKYKCNVWLTEEIFPELTYVTQFDHTHEEYILRVIKDLQYNIASGHIVLPTLLKYHKLNTEFMDHQFKLQQPPSLRKKIPNSDKFYHFNKIISKLDLKTRPIIVLDIGVGDGQFASEYETLFHPETKYITYDILTVPIKIAKHHFHTTDLTILVNKIKIHQPSLVIFNASAHHIHDFERFICMLSSFLKPGTSIYMRDHDITLAEQAEALTIMHRENYQDTSHQYYKSRAEFLRMLRVAGCNTTKCINSSRPKNDNPQHMFHFCVTLERPSGSAKVGETI
jgi:2-polyprenyl-3-methyl-5-hydroxy-6-metoxy-1,4-benzoquinol methylase